MPNETAKPSAKQAPAPPEEEQDDASVEEEDQISLERALGADGSAITGVEPYVLAGALAGTKKKSFTRDELKDAAEKFMAHKEVSEIREEEK